MRTNDTVQTGAAISWLVPRAALLVVVAAGAALLIPLIGWSIAAVVLGLVAAVVPQSHAAWGSVACFVIGMLAAGPDLGRTMMAVLIVHAIHVLASLTLIARPGTTLVIKALRPTALRFLVVQAVSQPLALLVMLGAGVATLPWAVVAGAGALVVLTALLLSALSALGANVGGRS